MRNLIKYLLSLIFAVETFGATNVVDVENKESAGGAAGGFSFLEKGSYNGYYPFKRSGGAHLDLSENWLLTGSDSKISPQFAVSDSAEWISVEKPTSVQTAHFQAGKLPDPYVGLNSKLYEPLEKKIWYYKKRFSLKDVRKSKYAMLFFEGADYFSRVWLNGTLLGEHQGMNGGPMFEVGEILNFGDKSGGENELLVEIIPAHKGDRSSFNYRKPGKVVKAIATAAGTGAEAFFSFGMWDGARIEFLPHVHMERPFLRTKSLSDNSATLSLEVEILAYLHSAKHEPHIWKNAILYRGTSVDDVRPANDKFSLGVELSDASGVLFKKVFPLEVHKGRNWFETDFKVENPRLWWPNGMGEPHLYDAKISLIKNGKTEVDTIAFKTGVRRIERTRTTGPRVLERWDDWQFVVNGKPVFIKGANWMMPDVLCDLQDDKYRWMLDMARNANVQMLRIWGGGVVEKNAFYDMCAERGILVWQDFTLWHQDVPLRPYNVWEEQVMYTIFRLRNNPALALWCGGNGFNPFSAGNTQYMGILERSLNLYDPSRPFVRSSSDAGNVHNYPDMDPCWYSKVFANVPFISETGIHCVMSASNVRRIADESELGDVGSMYDKSFAEKHPQLMNHFVEYEPSRIPRMLSRASHIDDMANPDLESVAVSTQIGASEFYKILSEQMQSNYPRTAGLLPWVFGRSWPVFSAIMLIDGFGQPCAPYYFLKRTYEKNHVSLLMPRLIWGKGENVPFRISISNADTSRDGTSVSINVYRWDFSLEKSWKIDTGKLDKDGIVKIIGGGSFAIPENFEDKFFFVEAVLKDGRGETLSRSVYWPRCLAAASSDKFKKDITTMPIPYKKQFPWPTLKNGPWLKPAANAAGKAELRFKTLSIDQKGETAEAEIEIRNDSANPSFMTTVDIGNKGAKYYATDNFFWLPPHGVKRIKVFVSGIKSEEKPQFLISSWNAK